MAINNRIPAAYIPHGGGPMPLLGEPGHTAMVKWLATFNEKYLTSKKPTSILVISAHWEESVPTILATPAPDLYYDYYGFPSETYNLDYKILPAPNIVKRIDELLTKANIKHSSDTLRGYDHGVFIPLKLIYPGSNSPPIPVAQLSLVQNLDPEMHYKIGQALAPLRDEGVLILGSGMSSHSRKGGNQYSEPFHQYLHEALFDSKTIDERKDKVCDWKKAPHAKTCHPREEHLIPLMVILGSVSPVAGEKEKPGKVTEGFYDNILGTKCAGYIFE